MRCLGLDFTSAPRPAKPITLACGECVPAGDGEGTVAVIHLHAVLRLPSLAACEAELNRPGPWVGAFDFPFGLPREFVAAQGWPLQDWGATLAAYCALPRETLKQRFQAFMAPRPAGQRFTHRATDLQARSHPSMKWVNPPVAWMMHAGVPLLRRCGLHLPGLQAGDETRVALEGYPALLARAVLGRASYKSDTRAQQTAERRAARARIVQALQAGAHPLRLRLQASAAQCQELISDPMGDALDAVLCLLQAAWAVQQPHWGRPADADALEGWIVAADRAAQGFVDGPASGPADRSTAPPA